MCSVSIVIVVSCSCINLLRWDTIGLHVMRKTAVNASDRIAMCVKNALAREHRQACWYTRATQQCERARLTTLQLTIKPSCSSYVGWSEMASYKSYI